MNERMHECMFELDSVQLESVELDSVEVKCGWRHGPAEKCKERSQHVDAHSKGSGGHCLGAHPQLPEGYTKGVASGVECNCLIDSLAQLIHPAWTAAGRQRAATKIRKTLPGVSHGNFLDLRSHWRRVVRGLGKNPRDYRILAYSPLGPQACGAGGTTLRLYNENFAHFVPLHFSSPST